MLKMHRWLPFSLALVLALPPGGLAQTPAPAQASPGQPATIRSLKIVTLAGNQGMNDLENRVNSPLVVQVLDQNDLPVDAADVIFRFPMEGPSASFAAGPAQTFRTNADGQASAVGWMPNGKVGTFQVQVTASRGAEQGFAIVSMTNVTRITDAQKKINAKKHWYSTTWGKVAIVAGVAAVVAVSVLATRGSSPRVITVTPGSPSIGGPQ